MENKTHDVEEHPLQQKGTPLVIIAQLQLRVAVAVSLPEPWRGHNRPQSALCVIGSLLLVWTWRTHQTSDSGSTCLH